MSDLFKNKIRVLGNGSSEAWKDIDANLGSSYSDDQAEEFALSRGYERGIDSRGVYYVPDIPRGEVYENRVRH